jgi:hypothetical protein
MNVSWGESTDYLQVFQSFMYIRWRGSCKTPDMHKRRALLVLIVVAAVCAPVVTSAVTLNQVVAMSKAGVSDAVILETIARDNTLLTITPEQVVTLRRDGLSDAVVLALLKSGMREENSPRAEVVPLQPSGPILVVVGHDPDRPNAPRRSRTSPVDDCIVGPPQFIAVPVPVPYAVDRFPSRRSRVPEPVLERTANPLLCVERVSSGASAFAPALTRVTECPAVMQPYQGR